MAGRCFDGRLAALGVAMLLLGDLGSPLPVDGAVASDSISRFVVFATHGVWLRQGSTVQSGDVGVLDARQGPWLESQAEISVGQDVRMGDGTRLEADSIKLRAGASAYDVGCNELENKGQIRGSQATPLALPLNVALPPIPVAAPGTQNHDLARGTTLTLTPGAYGAVMVRANAVLLLSGGSYHIRNLNLGANNSKVLFQGPTDLIIQDHLEPGRNSIIGPAEGSGVKAHDIRIYVHGVDGTAVDFDGTPKAAVTGESSTVKANIYAPNGTVWIRHDSEAEGAFIGKDVRIGVNTTVSLDTSFGAPAQYVYYRDADADRYGDGADSLTTVLPTPPPGYVLNGTDCDDADPTVNPGAAEACNGLDDDCSGIADEGCLPSDGDGDGIADADDLCSGTLASQVVDANGCSAQQPADSDGDGVSNYVEAKVGTDPRNPNDAPVIRIEYGYGKAGELRSSRVTAGRP